MDYVTMLSILHCTLDTILALCLILFMRVQIKINDTNYRIHKSAGKIIDGHQEALVTVHKVLTGIIEIKSEPQPKPAEH